jgi:TolA-binding protein
MNEQASLGEIVARELGNEPAPERLRAQRERFVNEAGTAQRSWLAHPRVLMAAAALAGAAAVVVVVAARSEGDLSQPDRVVQSASASLDNQWIEGPVEQGATRKVVLPAGARLELGTSARARVQPFSERDQRVTLESGVLRVDVDTNAEKRWSFYLGSYTVEVIGTMFELVHVPEQRLVKVMVERGKVRVSGGSLDDERVVLSRGDSLNAQEERVEIVRAPAALDGRSDAAEHPALPALSAPSTAAPGRDGSAARTWLEEYRLGRYADALALAERSGWDALLSTLPRSELHALSDAARLAGNVARAKQGLEAVRKRFPGSNEARAAAFLLGRLAADGTRDYPAAARWFRLYLDEQPEGAYAPEARGRLMVVFRNAGNLPAARAAAEQYLERHPKGPHHELAQSLVAQRH